MAGIDSTFSESWYRVANLELTLRPGVRVRRQRYRGEVWFVLENPFNNQFFRMRPGAYGFIGRLRKGRTVEEAWKQAIERQPDDAPGQEAAIALLSQLYHANLLQYEVAADSAQLFDRYKKRRQREVRFGLMNIMFMKFPLLDPDRFLVRTLPAIGKLVSPLGALLWAAVVAMGLKVAFDNFPALWDEGQGVLSPGNIPLLYLGLILVKGLHEFGHAYFCRKFGGEVHTMGIMLMIFTPIPYVDASSSWGFRSRWKRVLVGFAGMIVELFVAAIAALVWARTGEGALHSLAYNIMFVASVSTVIFNINPLLRFDGYYILSDLLEMPNLHQKAQQQLHHLAEKHLFGLKTSESPADSKGEAWFLGGFSVASTIYRFIVFGGILLAVADRFLIIGLLMALVCIIAWITAPLWKLANYLASNPKLERVRTRAIAVTAALALALFALFQLVPFPSHFRAQGVVRAAERTQVANAAEGFVAELIAKPGEAVAPGAPLLRLANPELDLRIAEASARRDEMLSRLLRARSDQSADVAPLSLALDAAEDRLRELERAKSQLVVSALHGGIWVAPGIGDSVGRWISRGSGLGLLVNPERFEFASTVLQDDADALFARRVSGAEIRLHGQVGDVAQIKRWRVVPADKRTLPSPVLGWMGGGEMAVSDQDREGRTAVQPFFEVICQFDPEGLPGRLTLLDGQSGKARFDLPWEPLLPRWVRRLRQLVQKRYQV